MKALTFIGVEKINYETVADPAILDSKDVIVKVSCCAICGSDLHVYHGREVGIDQHTCMGHEFAGEVVEVGKDLKELRRGDVVISPFTISCGHCYYCKIGLTSRCIENKLFGWVEDGKGLHGGQAEYVRVPLADSTLIKLPEEVSIEEGVLAGDVISTGFYSAKRAQIKKDGVYAVVGCGPVGLMAILGAREYGAEKIYAIDKESSRLEVAKQFGAVPIDASKNNALEIVKEASQGRGADAVMEAIGNAFSLQLSYNLVRPGGIISSVGVCTEKHLPFSPVQAYDKNLTYASGRCPARAMMPTILPLIQQKKYPFKSIIT
ncbi:MAG TPA: alcohol dehydrogenase catalytic domain-containing protein, partial [Cyclobacteriaceae bacterium]|nr:alcohol dehydrogenase catalytic domain-containing protein [Cyclobacteriaceae bacterium]